MSPLDYFCTVREQKDFYKWKYGKEPTGMDEPETLSSEVTSSDSEETKPHSPTMKND